MDFLNSVIDFFNQIITFLSSGIYDFFVQWFAEFVIWSTVSAIKFKIFVISVSWDVAQSVLQQLDVSSYISTAFSSLDADVFSAITFFKVPEAVHIVTSAYVTRYVMSFVGL
jgi:hypothetical protein